MQVVFLLALGISTGLLYLYKRFLTVNYDPREPPILPSKFPLFGHIIGMMRKKTNYYWELKQRHDFPIYTLIIPGSKIYVVNATELIGSVQRQHKILAFPPVEAKFAMTVCNSSQEANDILNTNVNGDEGDWGLSVDFYKSLHTALAPGQGLDAMNRVMVQNIAASLDGLKPLTKKGTRIKLVKWLRHHITLATTNSVYGPMNPFQDPKIEEAFWNFESDLVAIMVNVLPSLTGAKGYHGRAAMGRAFLDYFQNKGHEKGSVLVQARYATGMKHKVPLEDIARHEVGGVIAILVNTSPAIFWMLFYVFSHPEVLEDCRQEIDTIVATSTGSEGNVLRRLDITDLKSKCPILISTFQEVLRHKSLGTSVRQVMQNTVLDNKYLLTKDSIILMPNIVVHKDPKNWGPDAFEFSHKRFLKDNISNTNPVKRRKVNLAAFRGFGGGTTLCPGRHFATTEILAVMIIVCMRYEISPLSGQWVTPATDATNIVAGVLEPDTDIEVDITFRKGFENGDWAFQSTDSDIALNLS